MIMKISQKKTCKGCRAWAAWKTTPTCDLGYEIQNGKEGFVCTNAKPMEPCPKPTRVADYVKALNTLRKYHVIEQEL